MTVKKVHIKQFSAFESAEFSFCPGINVLMGENATGKSHVMKLIYSVLKSFERAEAEKETEPTELKRRLSKKLARVFRPDEGDLSRLIHRGKGSLNAKISISSAALDVAFDVTSEGRLALRLKKRARSPRPIFLPTREVLAMYDGFIAAYESRELAFDETYYDACLAMSASRFKQARLGGVEHLYGPIEEILGGQILLKGGRFYVEARGKGKMEAPLVAEGLRKLASLARLIANGSLAEKSVLFWDEPEANLNPQLIGKLVPVLRALAHSGVQIFLATHDYLLSRKLSLAVEYSQDPDVETRFFVLWRPQRNAPVQVEEGQTLADLEHNPILQALAAFYDEEQQLFSASSAKSKR